MEVAKITPDELMRGNLVTTPHGIMPVYGVNAECIQCEDEHGSVLLFLEKELQPIPITEEWLIKLGFEYDNDFKHPNAPMYFIDVRGKLTCFIHNCSHGHILHVHEAQNAFRALTQQPLNINK